jgi:peroxiredoxin
VSHSFGTIVALLCLLTSAGACSKPSAETMTLPTARASTATVVSSSAPPGSATPRIRETTAPPANRVGVLAPGTGVPVGQTAPDVHGRDLDGKDVALSTLFAKGPVLLAFYRGGWCPYCNFEIRALTTAYPDFQRRGVTPVAVSVDRPDAEARTKATYAIPFPVLSDSDATILEAFHVVKKVEGEELAKMKSFGVDLESSSGKTHHTIAIPALFLIDRTGVVRWAHSDADFKVRPSTAQILAAIDAAAIEGK